MPPEADGGPLPALQSIQPLSKTSATQTEPRGRWKSLAELKRVLHVKEIEILKRNASR